MEISDKLKNFIRQNIELINENSKEAWEHIYKLAVTSLDNKGQLTEVLLSVGIDPAATLGYIPEYYLNCTDIKQYNVASTVTAINNDAFFHCAKLTRITIPDNVTSIGISAFDSCKNLKYVSLGKEIKYIDMMAFAKCDKLESININLDKKEVTERFLNQNKSWRMYSNIKTINCLDGVIEL